MLLTDLKKKRILILIEWFLPGNKAGGPVQSVYSMLQILKPHFDFRIITTNCDLGSDIPYKGIQSDCWTSYESVPVYYFSREKLRSKKLLEVIHAVSPDCIYLNSFWSYYFSLLPLRFEKAGKLKCNVVLAPRGMLGNGALSIKPVKKKIVLSLLRFVNLHSKVIFHATTTEEANEIKKFFKEASVRIAGNLNVMPLLRDKQTLKTVGELKIFYLSRISKVKNLLYAIEVLSNVKTNGRIIYDIFGAAEDKEYVKECEREIAKLPATINVNFKGEIDFSRVQETIKDYHFIFLPTLNENFGHSIAESLKSACPVIISDQTPWNGVNKANCGFAVQLNNKNEFVHIIENLLHMPNEEYQKMSLNCIKFMDQNSDNQKELDAYQALFKS